MEVAAGPQIRNLWARWRPLLVNLPVDLPEHDVEAAQYGRDVGQHVAAVHEVHGLQVGKAGGADLAAVGTVGAVGDQIDAELALGRLHQA